MKTLLVTSCCALFLAGCHTDMWVQPKHHKPYQSSTLFADGLASRPTVEGTVPYGAAKLDEAKYTGTVDGKYVTTLPQKLVLDGKTYDTRRDLGAVLARGKERFHIVCSHCHGEIGDGKGMIAQRGLSLKRPPGNYHTDRLRAMPLGHFYDVITNGYGVMYSQSPRVAPDDRWAIVAYIRALQMSQNMKESDLTEQDRKQWQDQDKPKPAAEVKH